MSEREDTFHDIVEREAFHDYDPEPDYETPTAAEEYDEPVWRRPRARPAPRPSTGEAGTEDRSESGGS